VRLSSLLSQVAWCRTVNASGIQKDKSIQLSKSKLENETMTHVGCVRLSKCNWTFQQNPLRHFIRFLRHLIKTKLGVDIAGDAPNGSRGMGTLPFHRISAILLPCSTEEGASRQSNHCHKNDFLCMLCTRAGSYASAFSLENLGILYTSKISTTRGGRWDESELFCSIGTLNSPIELSLPVDNPYSLMQEWQFILLVSQSSASKCALEVHRPPQSPTNF
jgi:hypothetical protein